MAQTLLYSALFGLAAALVYSFVGWTVGNRPVSERYRNANRLFAVWWYTLGATTGLGALFNIIGYFGYRDLDGYIVYTMLVLFLICIALWGLLYYLVVLFTGKSSLLVPMGIFYLLYFFLLVYFILSHRPDGVVEQNWGLTLHYAIPVEQDLLYQAVLLLLIGPQILGALALFTLFFSATEREQKYRIAVVSWSIVVWFGSSLVASYGGFSEIPAWQVVSRLIGLGAAFAILAAYRPPQPIRRWIAAGASSPKPADAPSVKEERVAIAGSPRAEQSNPTGTAS